MQRIAKAKWIKALKSDKYRQGKGYLKKKNKSGDFHCCLGVLCEVMGIDSELVGRDDFYHFGEVTAQLPHDLRLELEIPASQQCQLVNMNDQGVKFDAIADWIEENL